MMDGDREQEMAELVRRARDGDIGARNRIVELNKGLVVHVCRRYFGRGMDMDDMIQEGVVELTRLVSSECTDWGNGGNFAVYATARIRGAILNAIPWNAGVIRVPAYARKRMIRGPRISRSISSRWPKSADEGEPQSPDVSPLEALLRREENDRLKDALEKLPIRQSYALRRQYGLGDAEPVPLGTLAREMGCSEDAVSSLLARGRRSLAAMVA